MSNQEKNGRSKSKTVDGQFVPLLYTTMEAPAWRAMSHGARSLYLILRRRLDKHASNNGRIYVSVRDASKELGSDKGEVARWFKELQHFGFIVMTQGSSLGSDGKGKAPHWKLTDCGMKQGNPRKGGYFEEPTRDFLKWNGARFKSFKPTPPKKQNPVRENPDTSGGKTRTPLYGKTRTPEVEKRRENPDISTPLTVRENPDISSEPSIRQKLRVVDGGAV